MEFHEIQFPTDISYGATGGPCYSTDVVTAKDNEYRNQNNDQGRCKYNIATGVKKQEQLNTLIAFFRVRKGKAIGFRFKDWLDYQATDQLIAIADGAKKTFQLIKIYEAGGYREFRIIQKPVIGMVNIYLDNVLQSSGVVVDYVTGIITFAAAPTIGKQISADFQFDVPVRFDTDSVPASIDAVECGQWANIPLVEVRL